MTNNVTKKDLRPIGVLVQIIAFLVVRDATGWAWYWVFAALVAAVIGDYISADLAEAVSRRKRK